jgi:adenylate cyclase
MSDRLGGPLSGPFGSPALEEYLETVRKVREYVESQSSLGSILAGSFPRDLQAAFPTKSATEQNLEWEITDLQARLNEQTKALIQEQQRSGDLTKLLEERQKTIEELHRRLALSFVLNRIHPRAREVFLESESFQGDFLASKRAYAAYVMAVDLRRSTELMLKSRKPELFAKFITALSDELRTIILEHNGVFDKFTGDGILAFFPDFYTGNDAGYCAVHAADESHRAFLSHYKSHYSSFDTVLKDIGLGIGIDFGDIHLVKLDQELAIVGRPVVYACRMAATGPRTTLLNQPAYEEVFEKYSAYCSFEDAELDVKHEGIHVGYSVHLNQKTPSLEQPAWVKYVRDTATHKAEDKTIEETQ